MSHNNNPTRLTNDQMFLINMLHTMYNENNRKINNHTTIIDELNFSNTIIRNTITQTLNSISNQQTTRNNASGTRQTTRTNASGIRQTPATNASVNNNGQPLQDLPQFNIESVRYFTYPLGSATGDITNTQNADNLENENENENENATENYNNANILHNFLQPIPVFPTQSQIENATRRVLYRDIISPLNVSCPILQENFENDSIVSVIRHCGHIFNTDELNVWFESSCRCPVCRYDVREYISARNSVPYPTHRNPYPTPINPIPTPRNPISTPRNSFPVQTPSTAPNSLITNIVNQITNGSIFDDLANNNYTVDLSFNIEDGSDLLSLLNTFTQNRNL